MGGKGIINNKIKPVIGHAIIKSLKSPKVELKDFISLPDDSSFTQLELPNLVEYQDRFYWIISVTKRVNQAQHESEVSPQVRIYKTKKLEKILSKGEIVLDGDKSGYYGMNIVQNSLTPQGNIEARVFYVPGLAPNGKELSLPKTISFNLDNFSF